MLPFVANLDTQLLLHMQLICAHIFSTYFLIDFIQVNNEGSTSCHLQQASLGFSLTRFSFFFFAWYKHTNTIPVINTQIYKLTERIPHSSL